MKTLRFTHCLLQGFNVGLVYKIDEEGWRGELTNTIFNICAIVASFVIPTLVIVAALLSWLMTRFARACNQQRVEDPVCHTMQTAHPKVHCAILIHTRTRSWHCSTLLFQRWRFSWHSSTFTYQTHSNFAWQLLMFPLRPSKRQGLEQTDVKEGRTNVEGCQANARGRQQC